MNGYIASFAIAGALASGVAAGYLGVRAVLEQRARNRLRSNAKPQAVQKTSLRDVSLSKRLLDYGQRISHALLYQSVAPLLPMSALGGVHLRKAREFVELHAKTAGCGKKITAEGLAEVCFRLACAGALTGALVGACISTPLAIVLGCAGALVGARALPKAMLATEQERVDEAQRSISQMLEVISLGLRSGLTFDRSFELYCTHFSTSFASECASSYRSWSMGLSSREEALRTLAASYRCDELERAMAAVIRSLRFGSSLSEGLEAMAAQSRENHRAHVAEKVAKAPVKMMLPTGTLILPAMLLLVLGPVILEFVQGF